MTKETFIETLRSIYMDQDAVYFIDKNGDEVKIQSLCEEYDWHFTVETNLDGDYNCDWYCYFDNCVRETVPVEKVAEWIWEDYNVEDWEVEE